MQKNLAIIIPTYKKKFLERTLESICHQTFKNFRVYIGDDCSPENLSEIIDPFKTKFDLDYKRFDQNLGGKDLVAHWERCIEMSSEEEWIWLFSDDDLMDKDCVKRFYETISTKSEPELLHFNVNIINEKDQIIENPRLFPKKISSKEFFFLKSKGILKSYVVEYLFKRDLYRRLQGFQKFDLAWFSDDATWIKFASNKGIHTIQGAKVYWRRSDQNISPDTSEEIVERKLNSCVEYFCWVKKFFNENQIPLKQGEVSTAFRQMFRPYSIYYPIFKMHIILKKYHKAKLSRLYFDFIYLLFYRLFKKLIQLKGQP